MVRNILRYVVMFIALCIFGYAAYEITLIKLEDSETTNTNNSISQMFMMDISELEQNDAVGDEEFLHGKAEDITIDNSKKGSKFVWDYSKLLKYNSEAKGYIRQDQGPYVVDNPIMQHSDNSYYLKHLPNNMEAQSGSIFIDYNIEEGLEARNCIIYGHLMSHIYPYIMFGSLRFYVSDEDYAKTHPTFDVYVGDKHYKYYVFSAYRVSMTDKYTYQYEFKNRKAFQSYIDKCMERSVFKYKKAGEVGINDKIITMSTCTPDDTNARTIVHLVRRERVLDTVKDLKKLKDKDKNSGEVKTVEYKTTDTWGDEEEEEETTTEEETTKKKKNDKTTEEETTKKKKNDKATEEKTTKKKSDKTTEEETTKKKKSDKTTEEETTKKKESDKSTEEETTKKKKSDKTTEEETTVKNKSDKSTEEETTKKKSSE